ncbi:MAG: TerD family protein [Acidimicrobiales bacterium]
MSTELSKGGNTSLAEEAGRIVTEVVVGCGWSVPASADAAFDLDVSAIVCDAAGKSLGEPWLVFYGNAVAPGRALIHNGDNPSGQGEGNKESLNVRLRRLPALATRIAFAVSLYEAERRQQSFGQVGSAFIRVVDHASGNELVRYSLNERFTNETAVIFGELYRRDGGEWKFRAVGQGYSNGMKDLLRDHEVLV